MFKREDGGPERSLWNDFEMHKRLLICLNQFTELQVTDLSLQTQISQCYRFIKAEDQAWWNENLINFPRGYSSCNVLHSERIPSLSLNVRELLIHKYCPAALVAEIKASDVNQDCLIRPYLGRRRTVLADTDKTSRFQAFSLRNFPLHVDQMEQLDIGVDMKIYAKMMAEALAMIHWFGEIDANDVEFVLAPPRNGARPAVSNVLGEHTMWLLDFDCCRRMSMDEKGINQAVTAFFRNDPFYPRPGQPLWKGFQDRYLQVSLKIISGDQDDRRTQLPKMLIGKIEAHQKLKEQRFS